MESVESHGVAVGTMKEDSYRDITKDGQRVVNPKNSSGEEQISQAFCLRLMILYSHAPGFRQVNVQILGNESLLYKSKEPSHPA